MAHIEFWGSWTVKSLSSDRTNIDPGGLLSATGLNVKTFSRWFVFPIRPGNRIKVLVLDGTGVWSCQRRLHKGHFIWSKVSYACFLVTRHKDNFQS